MSRGQNPVNNLQVLQLLTIWTHIDTKSTNMYPQNLPLSTLEIYFII